MKIKNILFILFAITFSCQGFSQAYKIDIKISKLENKEIYLGHYYGDKTYVKDTIKLDDHGKGIFIGDSLLDQGVYVIVLPAKSYFDVLIGEDQEFAIETSTDNLIKNLKIKGSEENSAFKEFQQFMIDKNAESSILQKSLKELDQESDSAQIIKNQLEELSKEVKNYWDNTIAENDGKLIGVIVKAMKNPEIPEIEIPDEIQNKDSVRWFHSYNYNRQHYLDNIDFSDDRFLRTPIFHNKLETFFTKILIQDPDTLISYIDHVISQTESNDEMFEYILRYFFNTFQESNIMGMDKVLVHLSDTYYLTDKVDWLSDENTKKLREHVAKLRFNLVGNIAQDLKMETLTGEYAKLHEITAKYTLVYFWEPHCGHCKKITPKVYELYHEFTRDEFEVLAVYTQTNKEEWTEYIHDKGYEDWLNVWDPYNLTNFRFFYNVYSTPTIYLLDENKKIIAKRIGHETLRNILEIELGKKDISEVIEKERN
ncbi:thioredoxin-like domain-containing protein [Bacteroidota bacterium]